MTGRAAYQRLTLQLTPLLDLLLIVIFGQYLHVLHDRVAGVESTRITLERAQELEQQAFQLQTQLQHATLQWQQAATDLSISQGDLDRTLARQQLLGELVTRLFQLPAALVAQALDPTRSPAAPPSAEELEQLQALMQPFADQHPGALINHLLTYDEIRKRCDVWEIYVDSLNVATIDMGREPLRMRVPITAEGQVDSAALEEALYARYKGLPQPKTLVILLLTYDRGTRISVTQPLRSILPRLVARMQADSIGRSRFEYADLGFKVR